VGYQQSAVSYQLWAMSCGWRMKRQMGKMRRETEEVSGELKGGE